MCLRKIPMMQEFNADHTAYLPHTEYSVFNTDETLLVRAEAYALKGDYVNALADVNTELSKFMPSAASTLPESL